MQWRLKATPDEYSFGMFLCAYPPTIGWSFVSTQMKPPLRACILGIA